MHNSAIQSPISMHKEKYVPITLIHEEHNNIKILVIQ